MAESVVAVVAEQLCNLLKTEATFLQGVQEQVEQVQMELRQMRAYLNVAESRPTGDERTANNMICVRKAIDDAEDVVDAFNLMTNRRRRRSRGFMGFIERYGCIFQQCARLHNIGTQIEGIKATVGRITETKGRWEVPDVPRGTHQEGVSDVVDRITQEQRASAIRREASVMVGFDDEVDRIVATLLDQGKPQRFVISIVGMGGAGKSTLARRICNRADVVGRFDGCALLTVSQTWNLRKIFEDIAARFSGPSEEERQKMEEQVLKEKVSAALQRKRYLVVLDDVWKTGVWSLISPYLPDATNGSRIIITTRSMDVARSADHPSTCELHQLRLLRADESWELFVKIVFPGHEADPEEVCTGELKDVGQKILKSCGGLPLAVVLMGGLLSTRRRSPIAWDDAVRGISWQEDVHQVFLLEAVLALSYRDLPHHLKSCFLHLSHFPEDFDFGAAKLIRLWVAEFFAPEELDRQSSYQRSDCITAEEIAEGWLEDLVSRCMVQVVERGGTGKLRKCQMHDVLRKFSIGETEKAEFFHTWQQQRVASVRRLVFHQGTRQDGAGDTFRGFRAPRLRTFIAMGDFRIGGGKRPLRLQFLMSSKLLRVLDLESSNCRALPKAIGDLIHLRYLGLRGCSDLRTIPSAVGNLQNLQTLDVMKTSLEEVPDAVWAMGTLRHLFLRYRIEPRMMINKSNAGGGGLHQPVNLQTLVRVHAGNWMEISLGRMANLRVLAVGRINKAHHLALSSFLDSLRQLQELTLSTSFGIFRQIFSSAASRDDRVLPRKALALPDHRRLQTLVLKGTLMLGEGGIPSEELPPNLADLELHRACMGQELLSSLERLPYLKRLVLTMAYAGEEAVCSAGGFPQLEELDLRFELGLRRWTVEDGAMPTLKCLRICGCVNLGMLPQGLRYLRTLQTLKLQGMPPEFKRRLQQDEGGEDWYKIQHITSVIF